MGSYLAEIRKRVGTRRIFVPGVRALIPNQEKAILLQKRTDSGLWGLPGGAVEPGESALQALKREVMEETAITVVKACPMGLYTGKKQQFAYPNGDRVQAFAVAFIIEAWTGMPVADGVEGAALRFFPLADITGDMVMPVHQQTIADFASFDGRFMISD